MKRLHEKATLLVPDQVPVEEALARTTHLGIGAHQDDLEFMAFHGIVECFKRDDRWFGGVTCTNGRGSARTGAFAALTDEEMMSVRHKEQEEAAVIGGYGFVAQLGYPSSRVKDSGDNDLAQDLHAVLNASRPEVVYTHNPADKHATHIGVLVAVVHAIRNQPKDERPQLLLGCEVWRDLDWMLDEEKVLLDVSGHDDLALRLNALFQSQIAGGKRYDLAVVGRRRANATFLQAHETDQAEHLCVAIDLTPLIQDDALTIETHVSQYIEHFSESVREGLRRHSRS